MKIHFSILFMVIQLIVCQNPSPCPDVFKYEKKSNENDRWYGNVDIKTAEFTGLFLEITLDTRADLLGVTSFSSGQTSTKDNTKFTIRNTNYTSQNRSPEPIRFFVKYNPAKIIPSLKTIKLNGRLICTSTPTTMSPATMTADHNANLGASNRPDGYDDDSSSRVEKGGDFFEGDLARSPSEKPATWPLSSDKFTACGVVFSSPNPLIVNGQESLPGRYVLNEFGEHLQDRSVSNIIVHPEYNYRMLFNDIAVLKLSSPTMFTKFVHPCCLWEEQTNFDITGKRGVVIGWGFNEHRRLSNKLMQVVMPIVSTDECISSNRYFFAQFKATTNYCAGFLNGTSVCNGDSGGGMVFPRKGTDGQNTVWQIRGIVSIGVAGQNNAENICDPSQYALFTDVAKYTTWIQQVINK